MRTDRALNHEKSAPVLGLIYMLPKTAASKNAQNDNRWLQGIVQWPRFRDLLQVFSYNPHGLGFFPVCPRVAYLVPDWTFWAYRLVCNQQD